MDEILLTTDFGTKDTTDHAIDLPGLVKRLEKPKGKVDVVMDTDTYNEVDDQFAIAYMLQSSDKLQVKAIYAAPFYNDKSENPKDGMEKSYAEILNILHLMKREDMADTVYKGSETYLLSEKEPVVSDAANDLAKRAMAYTPDNPLYVIAIGAITNVASAILLNPVIRDRIVIVWLGGNSHQWQINAEFNLSQDIAAARVIFGSGAAVVQLPCMGVVSGFTVSGPELKAYLSGRNELCDYLVNIVLRDMAEVEKKLPTWSRVIWDVTAVAWLLEGDFMYDCLMPSPIPEYGHRYSFDPTRHPIRYVYGIKRDLLLFDLVNKLTSTS